LFKISNLVLDGKAIVRSLYSSLERDRKRTSWTCAGFHTGFDVGKKVTYMRANRNNVFLIPSFRHVLYVVCFLLGNYSASGFYMPTFRNTLSLPSS